MSNPYTLFSKTAYWRPSVAEKNMLGIKDLWKSKNPLTTADTVATAGSCFAQHISRAMVRSGFNWVDAEPAPAALAPEVAARYGYGIFTFRTGNIYTAAALRQWVEAAFDVKPLDAELWEKDGRFYDPLRPLIEPNGFSSRRECMALREQTLAAMRRELSSVGIFIFTLGLTESWRNKKSGFVYAACPGTLAGTFSDEEHEFYNQTYPDIHADLAAALDCIRKHNPTIKFLLTVSPVALVATASSSHVLIATSYSKSVLRAVAGDMSSQRQDTDYFPSYEIITAHPFRASFFMPNLREVAQEGVDFVMTHFFAGLGIEGEKETDAPISATPRLNEDNDDDIHCEEALLQAFER